MAPRDDTVVIPAAAAGADSTPTATPGRTPLDRARVIVVGGGVTGLAAAYQLAKRGAKVTLVEKAPAIGKGAGGSSPGYLFHSGDAAAAAAAVDAVGVVFPPPGFATGFGPVSLVRYLKGNLEKVLHGGITQAETPLPPMPRQFGGRGTISDDCGAARRSRGGSCHDRDLRGVLQPLRRLAPHVQARSLGVERRAYRLTLSAKYGDGQ